MKIPDRLETEVHSFGDGKGCLVLFHDVAQISEASAKLYLQRLATNHEILKEPIPDGIFEVKEFRQGIRSPIFYVRNGEPVEAQTEEP